MQPASAFQQLHCKPSAASTTHTLPRLLANSIRRRALGGVAHQCGTSSRAARSLLWRRWAAGPSTQQPNAAVHDPDSPVLVLAGFYIEEVATVRQLLDQIGGEAVRVVPTTPAMLHAPAGEALGQREARWDRPVPPDWVPGGGWGQQRMVLMAGIVGEGQQLVLDLLAEGGMADVVPAVATPANAAMPLGELLALALREHRRSGGRAGAGAAERRRAAAAEDELPISFADELPPVEAVVPAEVLQSAAAAAASGGGKHSAADHRGSEVVQAEYTEVVRAPAATSSAPGSPRRQPAASAAAPPRADQELPLDMIDAIASGDVAPSTGGTKGVTTVAQAGFSTGDPDLDAMDSVELLAAAKAALGLDSAELQRLVDEAAAQAAAALDVPFVPDAGAAAGAASTPQAGAGGMRQSGEAQPGQAPMPAAAPIRPTSSNTSANNSSPSSANSSSSSSRGTKMPWSVAAEGAAQQPAEQPARQAPRAVPGTAAASPARQATAGGQPPGGAPQPQRRPHPDVTVSRAAADSGSAAGEQGTSATADVGVSSGSAEKREPEGAVVPPVESFILSKEQLRAVVEKHGLDYQGIVQKLEEKGIPLAD